MRSHIQKILAGDEQAVTAFYNDYSPKILTYLKHHVPPETASELVNDVFLSAIDGLPTLRDEANLLSWLYRLAHNKTVDYYRKKKIKSLLLSQLPLLEIVASEVYQPEFQMEKDKLRDQIEASLHSLSNKYRQILVLHYEEHMPIKNLAFALNLTPKATESLLYRARQSFIKAYERTGIS